MLPASLTLIAPHQRASSGGVYVIEQLARHLSSSAAVTLAVRRGPTRPVAGVRVLDAPHLSDEELPDANVVIGGLAQPDPERLLELPPCKGAPLFLMQGYGTPENPRVTSMLERRPRVLAVSRFLADRAARHGCEVELTPPGLERSIFNPGALTGQRAPIVTMMTHTIDWKATDDGLTALAQVRTAMPAAELRLFGARPQNAATVANLEALHLGELSRPQVAQLLRETSVFLCASLEEGLGLPGLEALACGAALASTDTKGGRDYAVHERTALLTPPGRPDLLAESTIRLLRDPRLRERLSQQGREHVLTTYPPWPQAADGFHHAIARLLSRSATTAPSSR